MRKTWILTGLVLSVGAWACYGEDGPSGLETYRSFRPGQVWKDTDGKPIEAHGGGTCRS